MSTTVLVPRRRWYQRAPWLVLVFLLPALTGILPPAASATVSATVTDSFTGTAGGGANWILHDVTVGSTPGPFRTITLTWASSATNLDLGLRTSGGSPLKWSSSTSGTREQIAMVVPPGSYQLVVAAKSGGATAYSLTVDDTQPAACAGTFCGSVDAAKTSWAQHPFSATSGTSTTVSVDWATSTADLNVGVKDPNGTWVEWTNGARPGVITFVPAATGTYLVGVRARAGASAYTVSVSTGGTEPPACDVDFCLAGSVDVTAGSFKQFPIDVARTGRITASLEWVQVSADLNLGLRDPSGKWVKWASSKTARPEVLEFEALATGKWIVGVAAKSGASDFDLSVVIGGATSADYGTLGDVAFVDTNGNGSRDTGEAGLAGVRVAAWSGSKELAVGLSTATGAWALSVPPGTFTVEAQLPAGFRYGPVVTGGNSINPRSGRSAAVSVAAKGNVGTVDIGAIPAAGVTTHVGSLTSGSSTLTLPVTGTGQVAVSLDWDSTANLDLAVRNADGATAGSAVGAARPEKISALSSAGGLWQAIVSTTAGAASWVLTTTDLTIAAPTGTAAFARTVGKTARAEMYPSGLDVDDAGVVYVADTGNDAVAAYGSDGKVLWRTGAYGRGVDELAEPRDVAVTGGRVYVADTGNNRIKVLEAATGRQLAVWPTVYRSIMGISAGVDAAGGAVIIGTEAYPGASAMVIHQPLTGSVIRTIALPTGTGVGQVEEPRDAATGPDGRIYLADFRNHRIAVFSATGTWLRAFASLGAGNDQLNGPYGVDVDAAGNIYVADSNNSTIKKFSPEYKFVASVGVNGKGNGQFFQLRRAVVGAGSNPLVYGADLWGNKVEVFTNAGALTRTLGGSHPPTGGFNKPYGLALTATDMLVADTANHRVQRFTYAGKFLSSFGERGFGEDLSGLNWERDVAVSPSGMIWVADSKNNRLLEFTAAGAATGKALGRLGSANGQFNWPYALSFLGSDLVVADTFNDRVQRVTRDGVVLWTLSGLAKPRDVTVVGNTVFVADSDHHVIVRVDGGTGVKLSTFGEAALHSPDGLAVAPDGTVFVADTSWHRVVEFNKNGEMVRTFGTRGTGTTQFNRPSKIEIRSSAAGLEMFIADTVNDRVQVYKLG